MHNKEAEKRNIIDDLMGHSIDELMARLSATKILQKLFNLAGITSIVLTLFFTNTMTVILCCAALYYMAHMSCGFDELHQVLQACIDLKSDK